MKNTLNPLLLACFLFSFTQLQGQSISENFSVQISATVQNNPTSITLNWEAVNSSLGYNIFRRDQGGGTWGNAVASVAADVTQYEDNNVIAGQSYEYRIEADRTGAGTPTTGIGYVNSAIELPVVEQRGMLALIVDSTHKSMLEPHIDTLMMDLIGDGWEVSLNYIDRTDAVTDVKALLLNIYASSPNLKSAYLLGDVPVPYSGNIVPDGHSNNHRGAWSADPYYADMDGNWTDTLVNVMIGPARIHNVPGDGKFDQSFFPSSLELQIGRVDLANMPAFSAPEEELLVQYLQKAHRFKHQVITAETQAIIDDNFGSFSEGFAANGWRNFSALVGNSNVMAGDYLSSMDGDSYLWSYGCGGGSYTSANGIGNTGNFASQSPAGIFTMLFGSYFGDWDVSNNFLRAPLASNGTQLTNCWAGRPNWYFQHMGMGAPIGFSTITSMNNRFGQFDPLGFGGNMVHMALMGDPSLRMHIVSPPTQLQAQIVNDSDVEFSWTASSDNNVLGYYLYRADNRHGPYTRIHLDSLTGTTHLDPCLEAATYYYMLRALKLEQSPSGSYYNLSQGIFTEIDVNINCIALPLDLLSFNARQQEDKALLVWHTENEVDFSHFEVQKSGADFNWNSLNQLEAQGLSNGHTEYQYVDAKPFAGLNYYRLKMWNEDGSFEYSPIRSLYFDEAKPQLFPNPFTDQLTINLPQWEDQMTLSVYDATGRLLSRFTSTSNNQMDLNTADWAEGIYLLVLRGGAESQEWRVVKRGE